MSDTATSSYPGTCPECGVSPVTLLAIGDPEAPKQEVTEDGITVVTHFQFLNCEKCKHSWNMPPASKA